MMDNQIEFDCDLLLPVYAGLPAVVEMYFRNIPVAKLDNKPAADAWSIREHLYHIVSVQHMLLGRMKKIATEDKPAITPYFPETQQSQDTLYPSISEAFAVYRSTRKEQVEFVASLSLDALKREGIHPEYQLYTIPLIIQHMIFHEYWHMYHIEERWLTREAFIR